MKKTTLRIALALCALTSMSLNARAEDHTRDLLSPVGDFRGHVAVGKVLYNRIIQPGAFFAIQDYFPERRDGGPLLDLLGTYGNGGVDSRFQNGTPNPVNMILWSLLLGEFARDLGALCEIKEGGLTQIVTNAYLRAIAPLCQWPAPGSVSDAALYDYWLMLSGYEAPYEEFTAYKAFLEGLRASGISRSEFVQTATLAVVMSPYFLLSR